MKKTLPWLTLFLRLSLFSTLNAQNGPEAPRIYLVTINPETGCDSIVWYRSSSADVSFYNVSIRESISNYHIVVPSVYDTVAVNCNTDSYAHSILYTVWGVDHLGRQGLFAQGDSTIYLHAAYDSCAGTLSLDWNNCNTWMTTTADFTLYYRVGPYNYLPVVTVPFGTNSYTLNSLSPNQEYDLFVSANNTDGIRQSYSNMVHVYTSKTNLPTYINADYANLGANNTIDLSFNVDPSSDNTHYNLMRSTNQSGPFNLLASLNTSAKHITYTDNVSFTSGVYFYKLVSIDKCATSGVESNLACNILINGNLTGYNTTINWNDYVNWIGGVKNYRVIRTIGNAGLMTDTIDNGPATIYADDMSNLVNYINPVSSLVCYQVEAIENPNIYGLQGRSISNRLCFSIIPDVRMPNAFIPNDADPVNQVFEPVFSFLPEHYELIIYNRLGTKVWDGSSGWNGSINGKPAPQGVYVYLLRIFNYSTTISELHGKVTLVYR